MAIIAYVRLESKATRPATGEASLDGRGFERLPWLGASHSATRDLTSSGDPSGLCVTQNVGFRCAQPNLRDWCKPIRAAFWQRGTGSTGATAPRPPAGALGPLLRRTAGPGNQPSGWLRRQTPMPPLRLPLPSAVRTLPFAPRPTTQQGTGAGRQRQQRLWPAMQSPALFTPSEKGPSFRPSHPPLQQLWAMTLATDRAPTRSISLSQATMRSLRTEAGLATCHP